MKNILLMGIAGVGVFLILKNAQAAQPVRRVIRTITTTDGKEVTLTRDKDGYVYDQLGGAWA